MKYIPGINVTECTGPYRHRRHGKIVNLETDAARLNRAHQEGKNIFEGEGKLPANALLAMIGIDKGDRQLTIKFPTGPTEILDHTQVALRFTTQSTGYKVRTIKELAGTY